MSCVVNCSESGPSSSNDTTTEQTYINLELAPESVVILSIICALASISGSLGNSLVMLAVFKSESLRSIPDFIISSLAFSDFTVCFIYLPLLIYDYNHLTSQATQQNSPFSIAKSFIGHCSLSASVTNMFAVTVDRVIAIRFPLKYPSIMTMKTSFCAIGVIWLISLTFGAVYAREILSRFVILCYCFALMLGTFGMYAYIFFVAKRQENKVQTLNSSTQPQVSLQQQKAEKKAAKTIFTVVGIYALCWLPLLLLPVIVNPSKKPVLFRRCFPWVQTVLSCNSALNPYVYCIRSHKYRRQFAKLLRIKRYEDIHSNTVSNTHH